MIKVVFQKQQERCERFLALEMGQQAKARALVTAPISLTAEEMAQAKERFKTLDRSRSGTITINDLRNYFKVGFYYLRL